MSLFIIRILSELNRSGVVELIDTTHPWMKEYGKLVGEDATFYRKKGKTITEASHSHVILRGLKAGASYNPDGAMPYRGPGDPVPIRDSEEPTLTACKSFVECVRNNQQPFANADVGFRSAMPCSIGKRAFADGRVMKIPQLKRLS